MTSPVIGITLDYEEGGGYSKMPWYALRENYCSSVSRFGALPLPLPHECERISEYLDVISGLVITGGAFDVSPELYGQATQHETVSTKGRRTRFEFGITKMAIERNIPILGICGGEQLLNVVLGGTLIQHIPDSIPNALEHEQKNPRDQPGHEVEVVERTLLYRILSSASSKEMDGAFATNKLRKQDPLSRNECGASSNPPPFGERGLVIEVNSAHHQSVDACALRAVVNAVAPDGVIEGIELPGHPFCLGVQWHPEYFVTKADEYIMAAFVEACRKP